MKLYHGSNVLINIPDLSKSKPFKDFGKGFYLSPVYSQAITQKEFMIEDMSVELVNILMQEWGYDLTHALGVLYNSETFARLSDPASGLYYQSPGYVYDYLKNELLTGKMC